MYSCNSLYFDESKITVETKKFQNLLRAKSGYYFKIQCFLGRILRILEAERIKALDHGNCHNDTFKYSMPPYFLEYQYLLNWLRRATSVPYALAARVKPLANTLPSKFWLYFIRWFVSDNICNAKYLKLI